MRTASASFFLSILAHAHNASGGGTETGQGNCVSNVERSANIAAAAGASGAMRPALMASSTPSPHATASP